MTQFTIPQLRWSSLDKISLGLIYGAILVLSLLMAVEEQIDAPLEVAVILFGSVLAITLAKIFAELLSHAIETGERVLSLRAFQSAWRHAHPTLSVANLPTILFLAVAAGWLTAQTASALSQIWCVAILVIFGARVGWVISRGPWLTLVGGICAGGIGVGLAGLKHAIH